MFKIIGAAILIGVSNLIPGISGATTAVLTNQYNRLVSEVSLIVSLKLKQVDIRYLFYIGIGAVGGIILFSSPLHYLMTGYESYTLLGILALIVGSLHTVSLSTERPSALKRYGSVWFVLGLAVILGFMWIEYLGISLNDASGGVMLVLSGIIAMVAMIVPGVSGSLALIILGTYEPILALVKGFDMVGLIPFFTGVFIAGVIATKLIQWLLKTFVLPFESFVFGLLYGSIIYIFFAIDFSVMSIWLGLIVFGVGCAGSYWLSSYGSR